MTKKAVLLLLLLLLLPCALWVFSWETNIYAEYCEKIGNCTRYNILPFVLIRINEVLHGFDVLVNTVLALCLAFFTGALWWSTDKLWKAGEKQRKVGEDAVHVAREADATTLKSLNVNNRPWLDFSFEIASDFARNDTDFYENGFGIDVEILTRNFGKSPALGVRAVIKEVLATEIDFSNDYFMENIREKIRNEKSIEHRHGHAIFPSESKPIGQRLIVSADALKMSPKVAKIGGPPEPDIALVAWYIVSVFYNSPTDDTLLETSTVYAVHMKVGRSMAANLVVKSGDRFKPIPKRKIILQEVAFKRAK